MSEEYWVTGVQLGLLTALQDLSQSKEILKEIIDKQFIGDKKDLKEMLPKEKKTIPETPKLEGKITPGQLDFIKKLQEEGNIPEDFDVGGATKQDANRFIRDGIKKRNSKNEYL